jgi:hypothetical protein
MQPTHPLPCDGVFDRKTLCKLEMWEAWNRCRFERGLEMSKWWRWSGIVGGGEWGWGQVDFQSFQSFLSAS